MLLASVVAVQVDRPEFGTMMIFVLIALAAAMGLLATDSGCDECRCIRKLFGRKAAVEATSESKAVESESNPFGPQKR